MIAALRGEIFDKTLDMLIVDVQGVGYGVYVTQQDSEASLKGDPVTLYIYEHIREQSHDLFGFTDGAAKGLFMQLLDVNGVGPKMALSLLNIGDIIALKQAIVDGDVRYIQAAQGVGKRVAERVVVDLKDKLDVLPGTGSHALVGRRQPSAKDEAVQALVALGYSTQDAAELLSDIDPSLSVEERIRQALKHGAL